MDDVKVTLVGGPTLLLEIAGYRMITVHHDIAAITANAAADLRTARSP